MKQDELALQKAINSKDPDLIYHTLFYLQKERDYDSFLRHAHMHSESINLLKIYFRTKITPSDRSHLQNLLVFSKKLYELGVLSWKHGLMQSSLGRRVQLFKDSSAYF